MLGPRTRLEPGNQHGLDLVVRRVGVLAAKLRTPHRLAERAEVERRSQACGHRVRGVVDHGDIVSSSPRDGKFPRTAPASPTPATPDRRGRRHPERPPTRRPSGGLLPQAQQLIGQFLGTFGEFPPRQKSGSFFGIDRTLEN
jgi:hypothetical protein